MTSFKTMALLGAWTILVAVSAMLMGRSMAPVEMTGTLDTSPIVVTDPLVLTVLTESFTANGVIRSDKVVSVEVPPVERPIVTKAPLSLDTAIGTPTVLIEVAGRPIIALDGTIPAYRSFHLGMADGADILQLEAALSFGGVFGGQADETFDQDTADAVEKLYAVLGYQPVSQGTLPYWEVVFVDDPTSVYRMEAEVGEPLVSDAVQLGTGGRAIEFSATPAQRDQLRLGMPVRVMNVAGGEVAMGNIVDIRDIIVTESDKVLIRLDTPLGLSSGDVVLTFEIASTGKPALSASPAAIDIDESGRTYVMVAETKERIPVEIGLVTIDRVELVDPDPRIGEGVEVIIQPGSS